MVTGRKTNTLVWIVVAFAVFAGALWQQRAQDAPATVPSAPTRSAPIDPPLESPPPASSRAERRSTESVPQAERAQLEKTLALIDRGGPFPHKQDGAVFSNREKLLPAQPRGYYREYTVRTPGAQTRGARRVVRGKAGETWYTRDHYKSFVRIDQ